MAVLRRASSVRVGRTRPTHMRHRQMINETVVSLQQEEAENGKKPYVDNTDETDVGTLSVAHMEFFQSASDFNDHGRRLGRCQGHDHSR